MPHQPVIDLGRPLPQGDAVSFDVNEFDEAIHNHGVQFVHYRAMRCPVGITDRYDQRRPHDDHSGCSNGFLYTRAGTVRCLFTGNTLNTQIMDVGMVDGSTVQITLPRFYEDSGEEVFIAPFDRLYLDEEKILVPNWQLVEANVTGTDKLNYPAVVVQDVIDTHGRRYSQGDFTLKDGKIVWTGDRPGFDPTTQRGKIYAVRYLYRPYWYVKNVLHEVRVAQAENPYTSERVIQRMPQAVVLQREYLFEKEDNVEQPKPPTNTDGGTEARQAPAPRSGSFGPR